MWESISALTFFYAYTHKVKYRPRKERDKYPNLVYSTWDTVNRPRQVIVSDMTMIKGPFFLFEVTFQVGLRRKEELILDFNIEGYQSRSEVHMALSRYQHYYNKMRPCFALDYDTSHNFYESLWTVKLNEEIHSKIDNYLINRNIAKKRSSFNAQFSVSTVFFFLFRKLRFMSIFENQNFAKLRF